MLRFASLGSGSKGNATLIESGKTRILLDCGFSLDETLRRLQRLNCSPQSLSAIVVTHEHTDHSLGIGRLSRRFHLPVWLTVGTYQVMRDVQFAQHHFINIHEALTIQDIQLTPFPVPHDAREPCQFIFSDGDKRLAVLTDVGSYTPLILQTLHNADGLLLECNYEQHLLAKGPYPAVLKKRVAGRYGHLGNDQASTLLQQLSLPNLQHLVGMHLSEQNNSPDYALRALSAGLGCTASWIQLADQTTGLPWCELN